MGYWPAGQWPQKAVTGQRASRIINSDQGAVTGTSQQAGSSNIMTNGAVVMVETHSNWYLRYRDQKHWRDTARDSSQIMTSLSGTMAGTMESAIGNRTLHKPLSCGSRVFNY